MLDPQVRITNVRTVTGFDPVTTLPSQHVQTTYMVGSHGPFTLVTPKDKYSQEYVEQETQKTATTLRNLGAVSS